jgi:hypothetical protein
MTNLELVNKIIAHIQKHSAKYSIGAKPMSFKQFRRIANFIEPGLNKLDPSNTRDMVQFVSVQRKLNNILSQLGLKLKSRDYYSTWYMAEDPHAEVARMRGKAGRIAGAATRLQAGIIAKKSNPNANLSQKAIDDTAKHIRASAF